MPRRQTFPLSSNTWTLRQEQVEAIEALADARPGVSLSTVLRDIVDLGLPRYREQQQLLRTLDPPGPATARAAVGGNA
jgi:hypothetical protein